MRGGANLSETMTADFAARLARLDTCGVSDALDRLGLYGAVFFAMTFAMRLPEASAAVLTLTRRRRNC